MFLRAIKQNIEGGRYPETVAAVRDIEGIDFGCPVTLLCGENGSGKTTVMEIIAAKTGAHRIGETSEGKSERMTGISVSLPHFRAVMDKRPSAAFFFQAEDFVKYIDRLKENENEAYAALNEIDAEYLDRSTYAMSLAKLPHLRTLGDIENMFKVPLTKLSHGEGFLEFFGSRIHPKGLYLLDEPEAALSHQNQYVLMHMIADAVSDGSQLIISTHSPILLAYPGASIYELNKDGAVKRGYSELESIRFLKSFMADTDSYVNRMTEVK